MRQHSLYNVCSLRLADVPGPELAVSSRQSVKDNLTITIIRTSQRLLLNPLVCCGTYVNPCSTTTLCFKKNGHPFCFCYNFVSRDQILVIFGSLVAKEICNRPLLTYLKEIAGAYCYTELAVSSLRWPSRLHLVTSLNMLMRATPLPLHHRHNLPINGPGSENSSHGTILHRRPHDRKSF